MISKSFSRLMAFTVHVDTKNHNIIIQRTLLFIYSEYYSVLCKVNAKIHCNWHLSFCTSKCMLTLFNFNQINEHPRAMLQTGGTCMHHFCSPTYQFPPESIQVL